ncbi:uncharacterized protein LOC114521316 isoform X2 [Dendronephthya gigantea]|uniref:uncharacterized protein LOC114521316 isoform X2 n=1 Tax=Dendronephthya gigantea TaxID=151771 RepID=UPI00106C6F7D|nr:uncharacterized protein LOC114521316 isoform X2 [Dendronephthya gigantea]
MAANTQDTQQSHITVSCTAEFPSYKCDSVSKCWGLVTLKAANYEPEQSKRPALDIVAVIDRSGSMQGEKLFLVKKSLKFLVQNLLERDRLSVITYHTDVTVDFDLLPMNQNNKTYAKHKIESIQSASSTNLCGGLLQGLCSILDRGNVKNDVASVLLFTDGLANQGITAKDRIIRAMKDPKKYLNASDRETQDHDTLIQYQSNVTASVSSRGSASSRAIPNVYQPNVPNVPRRSFLSHMRNLFRSSNTSNVQQVQNRSDIQQNVVPPDTQNIQPAEETEVQPEIDKSSEQPAQALQQPLQVQNAEQQPEEKIKPATATGAVNQAENKEKNVVQITDASVYTFGFGRDHDPDMLKAISDAANGMYYFIENEEQNQQTFGRITPS